MHRHNGWQAGMVMVVVSLLMMACASSAQAQLQFEQRQVTVTADPGAEQVRAVFAFQNDGGSPVTITRVTSSCGCTAGVPDKRRYEPGERGELAATLKVGERQGTHTSRIVVRTDAATSPATTLTLKAQLPELVRLEPRLLVWRGEEELAPKTVDVQVLAEGEVKLMLPELEPDEPWAISLKPVPEAEGRHYRLMVTPDAEAARDGAALVLPLTLQWAADSQATESPVTRSFSLRIRALPNTRQTE